jgi:hypothetical protein
LVSSAENMRSQWGIILHRPTRASSLGSELRLGPGGSAPPIFAMPSNADGIPGLDALACLERPSGSSGLRQSFVSEEVRAIVSAGGGLEGRIEPLW